MPRLQWTHRQSDGDAVPPCRPNSILPMDGRDRAPVHEGQSLVSPPPIGLPRSALGVALLQHAALVPGPHHILTDWNGRKKDKLSVHVLASAAVEIELCI